MYPGKWRHGDWIKITNRNSLIIYGRSDATLNRGGIRIGKSEIREILFFDNTRKSSIFFQARSGSLPLSDRTHHFNPERSRSCKICSDNADETMIHFLFECKSLKQARERFPEYCAVENEEDMVIDILFKENNVQTKQDFVMSLWRERELKLVH